MCVLCECIYYTRVPENFEIILIVCISQYKCQMGEVCFTDQNIWVKNNSTLHFPWPDKLHNSDLNWADLKETPPIHLPLHTNTYIRNHSLNLFFLVLPFFYSQIIHDEGTLRAERRGGEKAKNEKNMREKRNKYIFQGPTRTDTETNKYLHYKQDWK